MLHRSRVCRGVAHHSPPVASCFEQHRTKVLLDLLSNQNDRSLAGRVDPLILPTVAMINSLPQYVTLSSCSGRFSLFHRGVLRSPPVVDANTPDNSTELKECSKRGAFGRGTLYQTHDPFPDRHLQSSAEGSLLAALKAFAEWRTLQEAPDVEDEVLQLKFEPMILHVMARSIDDAAVLLHSASEAGQRRSGILAISNFASAGHSGGGSKVDSSSHGDKKITVNITSALSFDVPLMCNGVWMLPPPALEACSTHNEWGSVVALWASQAQRLFVENEKRRGRLQAELKRRCHL